MAQLIDLTVTRRKSANKDDSFATPLPYGFDVEDIVVPVRNDGSDSYFTARQLKGTHPSSKSVGSTNYWVSESLTAIAAKSDLLVELTVTKRRSVDVASEKYVFVTSRFSESIKVSDTGGSKFFYQEDGDANLVEYEVSETIAQIVSQSVLPLGGFIELTYAQAAAEAAACTLVEGAHYKITDRADLGITLLAVTSCEFSLEGQGIFLNPDFQGVGDYSGTNAVTSLPYGATQGVWVAASEPYTKEDVVFWDGMHYQVISGDGLDFNGTDPSVNNIAYTLLPKSAANVGYIEEVDFILYDFDNDGIIQRYDKRNNIVKSGLLQFQWGSNAVYSNSVNEDSIFNIINSRSSRIDANILSSYVAIDINNDFTGVVSATLFDNQQGAITFGAGSYNVFGCTFGKIVEAITLNPNVSHNSKEITSLGSTFEATLDMTDGVDYNLATKTLTIPSGLNYVGYFILSNCGGQQIDKIVNLPSKFGEVEFSVLSVADTVVFNNVAVAGAAVDSLVADAVGTNTLTGRVNGNDFIRYIEAGTLNQRTTGAIMA